MKCTCGGKQKTTDSRDHFNETAERAVRAKAKEILTVTNNYTWRRKKCVQCGKITHTIELSTDDIRKLTKNAR